MMADPFHELRLEAEYSKQLKMLLDEYDALSAVVNEINGLTNFGQSWIGHNTLEDAAALYATLVALKELMK